MLDNNKLREILSADSSIWFGNGIILSVSDISEVIEKDPSCKGKAFPIKEILHSVSGHRSSVNGAKREFIDGYVDKAANMIAAKAPSEPYGVVEVISDEGWMADYVVARLALVMKSIKTAFSLNGNGISALSVYQEEMMKDVTIGNFSYNPAEFEILRSEGDTIALRLSNGRRYSIGLKELFETRFPRPDKICPHTQGCVHEVESLGSVCYDGSFKGCDVYLGTIDDGK